ncbi:ABC transporter permease [candidate division TA06 bacterium]|uniref:ABC transporter permease n=1 Tax=candidate division TA06 bacterium TaxID=2250710 RepID=A0A523UR59_UNCT6|nr:MAG: ABC transporter permease [candidate division TA06 bacterium]
MDRLIRGFDQVASFVGGVFIMIFDVGKSIPRLPRSLHLLVEQMMSMGVDSLPIVCLTSVFIGMVTTFQAHFQTQDYVPVVYVSMSVSKAIMIELGPIMTGLVVAGRVGSSIAAELGTMKVTEQIDALETLAIDPVGYLVMPRFVSGIIMLPVLVIISEAVAILGGLLVAVFGLGISLHTFLTGLRIHFLARELFGGLIKAFFFGGIIAIMGSYHGFEARGGAEGVGRATTRAVVSSSVLILISNYLIARLVFR